LNLKKKRKKKPSFSALFVSKTIYKFQTTVRLIRSQKAICAQPKRHVSTKTNKLTLSFFSPAMKNFFGCIQGKKPAVIFTLFHACKADSCEERVLLEFAPDSDPIPMQPLVS